jgi:PAS domain S-box-containing protein
MATILLADDEFLVRDVLCQMLEDTGHSLLHAENGAQALALIKESRPDVVITDIAMPLMDGYELVHQLRSDPELRRTPVIICTGVYDQREVESLTRAGDGLQVLLKPFEMEEVQRAVSAACASPARAAAPRPDAEFDREHLRLLTTKLTDKVSELEREAGERRRAEAALRESEERFRRAMEYAVVGMAIVAPDGRFLQVNRSLCEIVGYSEGELLGLTFQDITHPDDLAAGLEQVGQLLSGELRSFHMEKRYFRKDGVVVWVLLSVSLVRDAQGRPLHFISQIQDVTARRQAEEALRNSEALYHSLVDSLPQNILRKDAAGRVTFANAHLCATLGLPPGEVIGKTDFDLFPAPLAEKYRRDDLEVLSTGRAFEAVEENYLPDGRRLYVQVSKTPVFDAAGRAAGVQAIFWDVTQKRQAEEALRRAHRETEHLLSAIKSILIAVDAGGRVRRWNQAARDLLGLEESEVVGRSLGEVPISWGVPDILKFVSDLIGGERDVRLEDVRCRRADGKEAVLGVVFHPFKGEEGISSGCLITGADITERRLLEAQLRQAQKLESIGQLAAGIAHEINTPLQYVGDNTRFLDDAFRELTGLLDALTSLARPADAAAPPDPLAARIRAKLEEADLEYLSCEIPKAIRQSLEGISRVTKIVQSMKDFAHPGTAEKTAADLSKAIDSALTVSRNEWKYVAEVETDFDPALPAVPCLLGEFNQVVLNILINAAHAIADVVGDGSRGKGLIRVSTRREGEWAVVRISDTGTGIPEKVREKIFDPFFTTKQVGKGTGQGLAISHAVVVEKHGGQITFETELGKGTTFIIRLPLQG